MIGITLETGTRRMLDHDATPPPTLGPAGTSRITSPCLGHCTLDTATGWCLGCGRSGDEIAAWGSATADRRGVLWKALPARLAAMGADLMRADTTPEAAARTVAAALARPSARLSLALPGTALGVCAGAWTVTVAGTHVQAEGAAGRLDWRFGPTLRLLRPVGDTLHPDLIVLAVQAVAGLAPEQPPQGWAMLAASPALRLRRADVSAALLAETVFGPLMLTALPALAGGLPPLPPGCLPVAVIDPDGRWPAVAASSAGLGPAVAVTAE